MSRVSISPGCLLQKIKIVNFDLTNIFINGLGNFIMYVIDVECRDKVEWSYVINFVKVINKMYYINLNLHF